MHTFLLRSVWSVFLTVRHDNQLQLWHGDGWLKSKSTEMAQCHTSHSIHWDSCSATQWGYAAPWSRPTQVVLLGMAWLTRGSLGASWSCLFWTCSNSCTVHASCVPLCFHFRRFPLCVCSLWVLRALTLTQSCKKLWYHYISILEEAIDAVRLQDWLVLARLAIAFRMAAARCVRCLDHRGRSCMVLLDDLLVHLGDLLCPNCMTARRVILRMLASTSANLESNGIHGMQKSMEILCRSVLDPLRRLWGRELEASGEGEIREKLRAKGRNQEERYSTHLNTAFRTNFGTILIDFVFWMLWEHSRHFGLPNPPAVIGQLVCCSHLSLSLSLLDPFITQDERVERYGQILCYHFMQWCTVPTHAPCWQDSCKSIWRETGVMLLWYLVSVDITALRCRKIIFSPQD